MASYISSNDNRLYAAIEGTYGNVPAITAANYFSAVRMAAQQKVQQTERRDKTGTRSFVGLPARMRKQTTFDLQTYLTAWTNQNQSPPLEAFVQAALGGFRPNSRAEQYRRAPTVELFSLCRLMVCLPAKRLRLAERSASRQPKLMRGRFN